MIKIKLFLLFLVTCFFVAFSSMLHSHEEHHRNEEGKKDEHQIISSTTSTQSEEGMKVKKDTYSQIIRWLGNFHPIFLHFPIALIIMTVIAELLFFWSGNTLFDQAARFMIIAAAISAIPTALFGFAFGYDANYEGILANIYWWHRFFGVFTTLLTIVTAILRELHSRKQWDTMKAYYLCLAIIFISVNLTGFLGGEMTFGPGHLWPL
jgi:uncharacterized membrane protein